MRGNEQRGVLPWDARVEVTIPMRGNESSRLSLVVHNPVGYDPHEG